MNSLSEFQTLSLACMFQVNRQGSPSPSSLESSFATATSLQPAVTQTSATGIVIAGAQGCHVATDDMRGLTAILHGELYMGANPNHAALALELMAEHGDSFAAKLNGSFVLLIVSKHEPTVQVITDRLNSRRAFYSVDGDRHWISTSLHHHPTESATVNAVGVAHLLASGSMQNFHTPFAGVRVLEQASIHTLNQHGLSSARYWSLQFATAENGISQSVLLEDLAGIVAESVRVRQFDRPRSWVSLSGGYDSRLITQLLANEGADVHNFSYTLGETNPNADGYLAKEWSELLGQPHVFTKAYHGDFLKTLQRNADLGCGMLNFCSEIDSWFELAQQFDRSKSNAVYVGDTVFGFQWDIDIDCIEAALQTVHIFGIGELGPLKRAIPKSTWNTFAECLPDEMQAIFNRTPQDIDLITAKDYLYIDQRLPNTVLAWRTIVSDHFASVRNPFVDNRLLDFVGRVPVSFRRDRGVYLQMIKQFYPQVSDFRRAKTSGCLPEWRAEYQQFHQPLVDWLRNSESKLDALIPSESIIRLLEELGTWRHSPYAPRTMPSRIVLKTLKGTKIGNRIQRKFPTAGMKHLLNRIIPLRAFLGDTPIVD